MKVGLAICPNLNPSSPPLSLAYLASYLRAKSIEVVCMDFNIDLYSHANADNKSLWAPHMWQEWINKNKTPLADVDKGAVKRWVEVIQKESIQILGFSLLTTNVYTTMQVAKEIKKVCPDIKIVVGGPEVLRQLLLRHQDLWEVADVAVLGEGEEKLYQTITWLAGKNDAVMPVGVFTKEYTDMARSDEGPALPIDDLPYPDYSLFPLSSYKEKGQLPFIFSRGCIGRCAFCFEQKYWGKYRCRSVENVIGEMRHLKKEFNIWFGDRVEYKTKTGGGVANR